VLARRGDGADECLREEEMALMSACAKRRWQ
jgi:hypothetical protein